MGHLLFIGASGYDNPLRPVGKQKNHDLYRAILRLLNRSTFQVDGEILFEEKPLLQLKKKEKALYYGS